MSATLKLILIALGFASVLLLIGLLLRSKIKVLQKFSCRHLLSAVSSD